MAVSSFLKIAGIEGESNATNKKNYINIMSFSFGAAQHVTIASGGQWSGGKVSFGDLTIMKAVDKGSVKLLEACNTGGHLDSVLLVCDKAMGSSGQADFYKITLTDAVVTSIQWSGSSDIPMESISFAFQKIEFAVNPDSADGKSQQGWVTTGYDVSKNAKV